MKPILAVLAFALANAGPLKDVDEKLASETAADTAASEEAECWCKEFKETLDSRQREADSELQHLESQKAVQHYDNEGLRLEVTGHHAEASQHQNSIDAGHSILSRHNDAHEEEQAFHASALKSIRKAMDTIPEGSGGEVRGALKGLEQTFQEKMEKAEESHQNKMDELLDAKAKMMEQANKAAEMKQKQLAVGMAAVDRASTRIGLYTAQREADTVLSSALQSLCTALQQDSARRTQKRQQATIEVSQANVDTARAAARHASSNVVSFLSRNSHKWTHSKTYTSNTDDTLDSDLGKLIHRSTEIQSEIMAMLSNVVTDVHLASGSEIPASVKTAMERLGVEAEANMNSTPQLFNEVRDAGQKSSEADQHLKSEFNSE